MDIQKVSIIIPNYNGVDLLRKNLPKVIAAAKGYCANTEIIVVDDKSTDGSCEFLEKLFPEIILLRKEKNEGFSSTCNLGVKKASGDIVILLNSDVFPQKDFLFHLTKHIKNDLVFAVGCLDRSYENGKIVDRGRGIGQFIHGFLIHKRGDINKSNTLWVSGGSSAFDKSKWNNLGGFDEIYNPFYWEDIDLSYRAQKKGWKVIFEPKAIVHHAHEVGAILKIFSNDQIRKISYRNQIIFVWKNITDKDLIWQHLLNLPIYLIKAILRNDMAFITGFLKALIKLPQILQSRNNVKYKLSDKDILTNFKREVT